MLHSSFSASQHMVAVSPTRRGGAATRAPGDMVSSAATDGEAAPITQPIGHIRLAGDRIATPQHVERQRAHIAAVTHMPLRIEYAGACGGDAVEVAAHDGLLSAEPDLHVEVGGSAAKSRSRGCDLA